MIISTMYTSSKNKIFDNNFIHNTVIYSMKNLNKKIKKVKLYGYENK